MTNVSVEIKYTANAVNYRTVITAESMDAFIKAAFLMGGTASATAQGEDLVAAIKASMPRGKLRRINRYIDGGGQNDGPDGQPGAEIYGTDGTLVTGAHYKGGMLLGRFEGVEADAVNKAEDTRAVETLFARNLKVLAP